MKRIFLLTVASLGLAACQPAVPNSGVGFDQYDNYDYDRAQQAQALGQSGASNPAVSDAVRVAADQSGTPVPVRDTTGISDEQDFTAVSGRESIESDAQRLEAQKQNYTVVEPKALPKRGGSSGSSIVEYALSTTNPVGQPIYSRSVVFAESRYNRNCAKYASSDLAQEDFLRAGGPKRDTKGLDPDGDGFACYWDPTPFRKARG